MTNTRNDLRWLRLSVLLVLAAGPAWAQNPWDMAKQVAGGAATQKLEQEINKRLLAESQKNQCSFKKDSDLLAPGCDAKVRRLANALIDAQKRLRQAGVRSYKFEVSGHTDTTGNPAHNKELSLKRAQVIERELVSRGIPQSEITAVGRGAEQPLVKPDNTEAKRAKNRRYELRVRL